MTTSLDVPSRLPRPGTVTASSYLMYVAGVLCLVGAGLQLGMLEPLTKGYEATGAMPGREGQIAAVALVLLVAQWLLPGSGLAVLGALNGKGRNAARVVTWVVGGVLLCCCGFGTASDTLSSIVSVQQSTGAGPGSGGAFDVTAMSEAVAANVPGWYYPTNALLKGLTFVVLATAVVLLSLPASNAYFRKPVLQTWAPVPEHPTVVVRPPTPPES